MLIMTISLSLRTTLLSFCWRMVSATEAFLKENTGLNTNPAAAQTPFAWSEQPLVLRQEDQVRRQLNQLLPPRLARLVRYNQRHARRRASPARSAPQI
jgi:hypothetical protein